MSRLIKDFMLSCAKATELIEKRIYFKLSLKEKARLYVHTSICSMCRNYQKQSIFLHKVLEKKLSDPHFFKLSTSESDKLKSKIINKLEKK